MAVELRINTAEQISPVAEAFC